MSTFAQNLALIQTQIKESCARVGRDPSDVFLLPISKTMPVNALQEALQVGCHTFGENKVQELLEKKTALENLHWHFVGRFQTNKVKSLLKAFKDNQHDFLLQSLDRESLAEALMTHGESLGYEKIACLLQVNLAGEGTKAGFSKSELLDFLTRWKDQTLLDFRGLMTIGPHTEDQGTIRTCFKQTRELFLEIKEHFFFPGWGTLSMGMSGDFQIAIEEGSTLVRLGTSLFGPRQTSAL